MGDSLTIILFLSLDEIVKSEKIFFLFCFCQTYFTLRGTSLNSKLKCLNNVDFKYKL